MTNRIPRAILVIVILAFLVRMGLAVFLYAQSGERLFLMPDSHTFLRMAENILAGNGVSTSESAPFLPSAHFPPLYPFLLAGSLWLTGSFILLVFLQIISASLVPLIIYKIVGLFTERTRIGFLAAGLGAFEPLMVFFSVLVLPHTLALVAGLFAVYSFLKFVQTWNLSSAVWSSIFLAFSTLLRPHGQFLFLLALVFLAATIYLKWRRIGLFPKRIIYSSAAFAFVFLLFLSPWVIRNYHQFGVPIVAATGLRNFYTDVAVSVLEFKTGRPNKVIEAELEEDFAKRHGVPLEAIGDNPALGKELAKEGLRIAFKNPREALAVFAITINSFFTQDLYLDFAQRFHFIEKTRIDFSSSVVLLQEGPVELARKLWERAGASAFIGILGRLVWVALNLFALSGIIFAIKAGGEERRAILILAAIIGYYALTSQAAGFSAHAFHRFVANPLIFVLASYGGILLWDSFRRSKILKNAGV